MAKTHFYTLYTVSFILAVLILSNLGLVLSSQSLSVELLQTQITLNNSRRAEQILSQLSMRIARDADREPALRELLKKHQLQVTLEVDGKKKAYP